jgi:hypothetical protein
MTRYDPNLVEGRTNSGTGISHATKPFEMSEARDDNVIPTDTPLSPPSDMTAPFTSALNILLH